MTLIRLTLVVFILGANIALTPDVEATILKSKVVDAETNEPIEGAVVVVVWWRPVFYPCMDSCRTVHDAAETVTDVNGKFAIDISMGFFANERKITIYRPGYYRPSYHAAPWLSSREDPPSGESQIIRLIKARSLQDESKSYSPDARICSDNEIRQWCVPPNKVKTYDQVTRIVGRIQDSESVSPERYSQLPRLHEAAKTANLDSVRSLLEQGVNPNETDKDGRTALMLVTREIVIDRTLRRSLLSPTRGPQQVQEMRAKEYHEGSARNLEILRTLLAAGANPNLKTKNGDTVLAVAIPTRREIGLATRAGIPGLTSSDVESPGLIEELLRSGVDPNVPNNDSLTPLMVGASRGLTEIVKTLLAHGANVNAKASFGLTAYEVAMGDEVIAVIKTARGPRKRLPPPPGITARITNGLLLEAAHNGNLEVVRALIVEERADPNYQEQPSQETPIYYAIRSGNVATVETLLKHGANLNVSVPSSGSPIAYARKYLKPELASGIVKTLVDAGASETPGQ